MRYELEIPDYSPKKGLTLSWTEGHLIFVQKTPRGVAIIANRAGLRSLAGHLLNMAQEGVLTGHVLYLDEDGGLEPGSVQLALVLQSDERMQQLG